MRNNSILLISADGDIADSVNAALAEVPNAKIQREDASVSQLNGEAVKMAAAHDIVIFATDPSNAADMTAIEVLTDQRGRNTIYLALTDGDLPLSKARALSRAGVDDVLPYPVSESELVDQVQRWIEKRQAAKAVETGGTSKAPGKLIAVAQARGGIGATTVAVNLADQLLDRKGAFKKEASNKVCILDLDLQFGTVGDFLDIDEQEGLLQLAVESFTPDVSWVEQSLVRLDSGLAVMAAPQKFAPLDSLDPEQVAALVAALRSMFDYVVVDLPRALVSWIEPVLSEADMLMIVTDTSVPSIRATRRLMDFVLADSPSLPVEIVINREKKPMMLSSNHKEAAKALDTKFHHWIGNDPKAARESVDYGKPVSEISGRSDLAKGIAALAKATLIALPVEDAKVRV